LDTYRREDRNRQTLVWPSPRRLEKFSDPKHISFRHSETYRTFTYSTKFERGHTYSQHEALNRDSNNLSSRGCNGFSKRCMLPISPVNHITNRLSSRALTQTPQWTEHKQPPVTPRYEQKLHTANVPAIHVPNLVAEGVDVHQITRQNARETVAARK
jgi:hypothetical protein